ncbi:lysine-specific histone demethylase 1 [Mytilinidion resinicola]|uniref:Lysine-specific histone demethylase 1 n=1 Tax=Mytilinidion resinicola TaxID=574789 RepID=A0A6A6YKZ1_9PEZI|nr:lysine-specific histone demethylase 1 [Mytilinidion resinicola]KAF2808537.1 lysine-specific histone demethylase 1 [Mytilinidion resinicola]
MDTHSNSKENSTPSSKKTPRLIIHGPKMSSTPELSQSQEAYTPRLSDSSPAKVRPPVFRARSSIPSSISPGEFGRQGVVAAYSSRLNPYALHPGEYKLLREHITLPQVSVYLSIRNAILRLFTRNPLVSVNLVEAVGCAQDARYFNMAKVAYYWLMRNGYINFGCVEVLNTAGPVSRTKSKATRRRTIVVIGAGMSGLGCARQLEGLFAQLGSQWTNDGEKPPRVILLEGRNRVGGRVYSHPLRQQTNCDLASGRRCTAEMGAQIIVGFDHGNPMNAIIRGQLAIPYHVLRDNTILYDHDGTVVEKSQDVLVERLYNDILDRASVYRNKPVPLRTVEGDRNLIWFGKDTGGEAGPMISALEDSDARENSTGINATVEDKPSSGVEKLAGRAYVLTNGINSDMSAAEAAHTMGWQVKPNVSLGQSIDLDPITKSSEHPTLGETMDDAIRQYGDLLNITPRDMRLLNWHHANLEYANAATIGSLSLSGWDQDIGNEFEGFHSQIIGGYVQVPRGLWQCPTKLDIRFNHAVKSIRYSSEEHTTVPVRVECTNGEVFEADKLVITTPLGVLKEGSIKFEPPLPDWKASVIDRLGFGLLNKVILVYDTPFWEADRDMFGLLNEAEIQESLNQKDYDSRRGRFYLFWNCIKTSGRPMLVALMAGNSAHHTEQTDNDSLIQEVTSRLAKMFAPAKVPLPSETIVTRWKKDPFARGSYSYVGPYTQQGDYDKMAQSHGPLHFAGEATCGSHPATVHGAYISGLRAAAEVVESMIGPIKVEHPLVEKKIKAEPTHVSTTAGLKHKLDEDVTQQPVRNVRQARDEDYEASVIGAILNEIGERPIRPGRGGLNPFLLYTKDYWHICKADCDKARKEATGDPTAKASKTEVRIALGQMWRNASPDVKKPYLDQTQSAREEGAANVAEYNKRVVDWDREAARIRREYVQNNPPPGAVTGADTGKTAIENGGTRNMRR